MTESSRSGRFALLLRVVSLAAICAALLMCYNRLPSARAQETGPLPDTGLAKAPAERQIEKPAEKLAADTAAKASTLSQSEAARLAEAALAEGGPVKSGSGAAAQNMPSEQVPIFDILRAGWAHMWAIYLILIVSIVAVAFGIERILGLRRRKVVPGPLMDGLRKIANPKSPFDLRKAYKLCQQYPSSASTVVRAVLQKAGRPMAEIEHTADEAQQREAARLYANVRWQGLAFNVAPMLGLAGTVHGVIIAFYVTAHMPLGVNKMESLATGIYTALICTFAGLAVAIPAGVLDHAFESRILKLLRELDDLLRLLLPQLEQFEGQPRSGGKLQLAQPTEATPQPASEK
jgi:biopolymer transport protein ExbB